MFSGVLKSLFVTRLSGVNGFGVLFGCALIVCSSIVV